MNDRDELAYDAERLKALDRFGVALPRPLGEPPARTIARLYPMIVLVRLSGRRLPKPEEDMCGLARLPGDGNAGPSALADVGLPDIDGCLVVEEAYRGRPLPERVFWSPIQAWVAKVGGCDLPEVSPALFRSWVEHCQARRTGIDSPL